MDRNSLSWKGGLPMSLELQAPVLTDLPCNSPRCPPTCSGPFLSP